MTPTFETAYAALNPRQREAVDAIEGPVMVVAGPGTGKTQILTLRIANILKRTDTAPENILAITFTEAGVAAMRKRLADLIGPQGYRVRITTFHGFCNDLLTDFPEAFPERSYATPITEVEESAILERLVLEHPLSALKPFGDPRYYVRSIVGAINTLKRESVTPDAFSAILLHERKEIMDDPHRIHEKGVWKGTVKATFRIREKELAKNEELAELYRAYETLLRNEHRYDYNDMILAVLHAFETDEDFLRIAQEQYQYVLVDEHQDTNNAQNRILEQLVSFHAEPNVFVVGDEKQAIYRFQGASLENFLYFKTLYPNAQLIVLEDNYRSTQTILDAAHDIVPAKQALIARASHVPQKINTYAFSSPDVETFFIANDIATHIASGVSPSEIAVLYRDNRDASDIAAMLEKHAVPHIVESDNDVLRDPEIKGLRTLLTAISDLQHDYALAEALYADFLDFDPLAVHTMLRSARTARQSVLGALRKSADEQFTTFARQCTAWIKAAKNTALLPVLETVIRDSGFLAHVLSKNDNVLPMQALTAFFEEARALAARKPDAMLQDFLEYLTLLESHRLLIARPILHSAEPRVRLMTAHRSKGQEFDMVYIVRAYDGHWGNRTKREAIALPERVFLRMKNAERGGTNDDEGRLFYVALTRARKHVTITWAMRSAIGREQLPSVFVAEIPQELCDVHDPQPHEAAFRERRDIFFAPRLPRGPRFDDIAFVRTIFDTYGLSATALNHYLDCPWKYFYYDIVRIPRVRTLAELYGIAVHATLKAFIDALRNGESPTKKLLTTLFERHLALQPLTPHELRDMETRGKRALTVYYNAMHGEFNPNAFTEFSIPKIALNDGTYITGKLDKMEFAGTGNEVRVIDYKTGKPKSRNEMEGKTKSGTGNEKRQLVFYGMLLRHFEEGKYHMLSGEIQFIEPDEKGRFRSELFTVSDEEISALETDVKRIAHEIRTCAFWDLRCDDRDCEACALQDMVSKRGAGK